MPERLEAGTLNGHGLAGLRAGVACIQERGIADIQAHIAALTERFLAGVSRIEGVQRVGGGSKQHCGIVALILDAIDSSALADRLYHEYAICTRAGSHCAPLMHDALNTTESGAVRFSFSWTNTEEEIEAGIAALATLAKNR